MKKILSNRRMGKSTMMVRLSAQNGGTIVAYIPTYIQEIADNLQLTIPPPMSYATFCSVRSDRGKGIQKFLIDDIDGLAIYIAGQRGGEIEAISMSNGIDD